MKFILLFLLACCPIWCDIKISFILSFIHNEIHIVVYTPYTYTICPNVS